MDLERNLDPYAPCEFRLSGIIEAADARKIRDQYERLRSQPAELDFKTSLHSDPRAIGFVCLNSGGGEFREAIEIARFVIGLTAGSTVISEGEECLSACAIIFLAGSGWYEGDRYPDRFLHVGGTLGLHRPSLQISGAARSNQYFTLKEVNDAYVRANEDIGRLLELLFEIEIPATLIAQMMITPPETLYYIDTVDKAGRWGFSLLGYAQPAHFGAREFAALCHNTLFWERPFFYNYHDMESRLGIIAADSKFIRMSKKGSSQVATIEGYPPESVGKCVATFSPSAPDYKAHANLYLMEDRVDLESMSWRQTWATQLPQTPLRALRAPREVLDAGSYKTLVLKVQEQLRQLGYDPGPTDGHFGPKTQTAIAQFQEDHGLFVTNLLTVDLVESLSQL